MSFRVVAIIDKGLFKHHFEIEALEATAVDRIRFRTNAVGLSVVGSHEVLTFAEGDKTSVWLPKNLGVGSTLTINDVSNAISSQRRNRR